MKAFWATITIMLCAVCFIIIKSAGEGKEPYITIAVVAAIICVIAQIALVRAVKNKKSGKIIFWAVIKTILFVYFAVYALIEAIPHYSYIQDLIQQIIADPLQTKTIIAVLPIAEIMPAINLLKIWIKVFSGDIN